MPFYRIAIHYHDGTSVTGIRQHTSWDVDFVNRYYDEQLRRGTGKAVDHMEAVMVPKTAEDVKQYLTRHARSK